MPPKPKITKEILMEHAFKIADEQGISAVNSRSVAKSAGCSIQPIFSHFSTMEELRQATFDYACQKFVNEVMVFQDEPDFTVKVILWTLDLARNRQNLYRLLYLSGGFKGDFIDSMMGYESNKKMLEKTKSFYGIDDEACKSILMRSCLFLMGICTMICENHLTFTDEEVLAMMKQTVTDMVMGAKGGIAYEKDRFDKSTFTY